MNFVAFLPYLISNLTSVFTILCPALNEALNSEVQRLKLVAGETSDPQMPNASEQQMSTRMIQLHQLPSKAQQDQQQYGAPMNFQMRSSKGNFTTDSIGHAICAGQYCSKFLCVCVALCRNYQKQIRVQYTVPCV
jgi:hypothetical protein